ncbi:MAG: hypothetical protein K7J47_25565 [Acidobacteria bacterium]|nr:hypothetical protein [Bryobacteraceae bacterium CoA2 C42]
MAFLLFMVHGGGAVLGTRTRVRRFESLQVSLLSMGCGPKCSRFGFVSVTVCTDVRAGSTGTRRGSAGVRRGSSGGTCPRSAGPCGTSARRRPHCGLDEAGERTLEMAVRRRGFSARAHDRILKVARTIAEAVQCLGGE